MGFLQKTKFSPDAEKVSPDFREILNHPIPEDPDLLPVAIFRSVDEAVRVLGNQLMLEQLHERGRVEPGIAQLLDLVADCR